LTCNHEVSGSIPEDGFLLNTNVLDKKLNKLIKCLKTAYCRN